MIKDDLKLYVDECDYTSNHKHNVNQSRQSEAEYELNKYNMHGINVYLHQNVIYKVTNSSELMYQSNIDKIGKRKWKHYGQEFLALDSMFDNLFLLSKLDQNEKLRIPLAVVIDYKGFRGLVYAKAPVNYNYGSVYGFECQNNASQQNRVRDQLS